MSDSSPVLLIAADPELRALLESAAVILDRRVVDSIDPTRDPVAQMADLQPALIVIEAAALPIWLAEVRASPATRRLPILIVGEPETNAARLDDLHLADRITPAELRATLPNALHDRLRAVDAGGTLIAACAEQPSELALRGLHEFNTHAYFECHETLEVAWNAEPGPVRDLYRVILQVGLAYYQIERANYVGALKMFLRTMQWFDGLPDQCRGIDLAQLRADAAAARAHLEALGPARIAEFDRGLLKPVLYSAFHHESI